MVALAVMSGQQYMASIMSQVNMVENDKIKFHWKGWKLDH